MKVQDVILRAMAKRITWWQAAEIIGISDRQMRRWRRRYEKCGYDGLWGRRMQLLVIKFGLPTHPGFVDLRKPLGTMASCIDLLPEKEWPNFDRWFLPRPNPSEMLVRQLRNNSFKVRRPCSP